MIDYYRHEVKMRYRQWRLRRKRCKMCGVRGAGMLCQMCWAHVEAQQP